MTTPTPSQSAPSGATAAFGWRAARHRAFRVMLEPLPDWLAVQILYLRTMGRTVDMRAPRTMTEKINWRKICQRDPRFTTYSDKFAVKRLIAELAGPQYLVPTLWTGVVPDELPFDNLEPPYVIKATHSTNNNIFIRSQEDVDPPMIREQLRRWLAYDHSAVLREWAYKAIPRRILVERLLLDEAGRVPSDYKFFVYRGRVRYVQFDHDRFGNHTRAYFNADWRRLQVDVLYPPFPGEVPLPEHFEQMRGLAETVGRGFDFVRVDLYDTDQGVYFGETTFYPGGGFDRFEPPEWDFEFGRDWDVAGDELPVVTRELGVFGGNWRD